MSKNKVIFHKTKSVCDENIPDFWNDMAVVNAYDSAVSNNQRISITFNESPDEYDDDDCNDTKIGDVVWKRKPSGQISTGEIASGDGISKPKAKKKKRKRNAKRKRNGVVWKVGDTCMALYAGDNRYYKAKIVELFTKKVVIRYEDYDDEDVKINYSQIYPEHLWNENGGNEEFNNDNSFTNNSQDDMIGKDSRYVKRRKSNRELYLYPPAVDDDDDPPEPRFMPPRNYMDSDLSHLRDQARDCNNLTKEALSSMLVSWYMAGYQTGYYRGLTSNN